MDSAPKTHLIVSPKIHLKSLELKDAEKVFLLVERNRAYLRNWLGWLDKQTQVSDTRNFINTSQLGEFSNQRLTLGVWFEGKIMGVMGFNQVDWANKSTAIGYWLAESAQGNGIITQGVKELVRFAFEEWKLNRVEIRCAVENDKSKAIPARLGFIEEGKIRQAEWLYDHFVDHVIYGLLRTDWEKSRL